MGNRRIILFFLCGIAVCSFLIWGLPRYAPFLPVKTEAAAALTDGDLSWVERITVDHGDARIGMCLKAGRWVLEAPFQAPVDRGAALRFLDLFESARVKDSLGFHELRKRELSLKEFGLAPARAHVVLEGGKRHEFFFGAATPLGKGVFVRAGRDERVLVVSGDLCGALPRTADDIRSRRLAGYTEGSISAIEIRVPERPFIRLSKESGTWRLTQPVEAPASDAKVEAMLGMLENARVSRFIWPTVSNVMDVAESEAAFRTRLGVYGLGDDTGTRVQLLPERPGEPVVIIFGTPVKETEGFTYVLLHGATAIGAVSNAVVEAVRLSPEDLRDMRLFSELPARVDRLQVSLGEDEFVLAQTGAQWRFETPMSDLADQAAVGQVVKSLININADEIEDRAGGDERDEGRGKPLSRVDVGAGARSWRFSIMPADAENRLMSVVFTNSTRVFRVAASNVPSALVSTVGMLGLRDKTVLALPERSLRRITLKRGRAQADVVERSGPDAAWRAGEVSPGKVDAARLSAVVALLEKIRADRVEKLGVTLEEIEAYGLRDPWLSLSADVDATDSVRKTLLVGKEAWFGKRYAMVRGLDILFVLSPETLGILNGHLVETVP
ncbi:MAG: DUF4340 domain-containing protein [Kiritimatiellae bacterium]|nr:DUF4340 domain-containing protein [Kiritimatiellia bacterium]MDD4024465.1 DUF4340 domain-containing protein [Kiritimatiellia bacterium]MDD4622013.1 DUF4340 domain-containing protein [Kiritimatiellia bacterium]